MRRHIDPTSVQDLTGFTARELAQELEDLIEDSYPSGEYYHTNSKLRTVLAELESRANRAKGEEP